MGLVALAMSVASVGAQAAATLEISPIRIVLTQNAPVAVLHIHNHGTRQAVVQLDLSSWEEQDGQDVLQDTKAVVASPPLFTLQPDEDQVVRVVLMKQPVDWNVERAYRLFVQEVPPPPDGSGHQVQLRVRISVPIFL
ncbi:MAG TPA: fimbria/pilus periplasmic chaperone, partial [Pseudomonadales bacterium]|nr:fimbria/pilus periplasmic chaperone [Pseudomonadales bacterium]